MPKRSIDAEKEAALVVEENQPSKRTRKTVETLTVDSTVKKKKELKYGSGTALKDIPDIAKEIRKCPAKGYDYYLDSLHCVMYGFASNESNRRKNVLDFSGFPEGTNREAKRKILLGSKFVHGGKCFLLKVFLTMFHLDTSGSKEVLVDRLLDFLFNPVAK